AQDRHLCPAQHPRPRRRSARTAAGSGTDAGRVHRRAPGRRGTRPVRQPGTPWRHHRVLRAPARRIARRRTSGASRRAGGRSHRLTGTATMPGAVPAVLPRLTAGIDEAGRGPLAGPVCVAAVILDPARPIAGLDDSKRLSARRREALYESIRESALACHIVLVDHAEIDRINILQATMLGMGRALAALAPAAELALVDGNRLPAGLTCPAHAIVGGDALVPAISAASILAKVYRDRYMVELDARYPGYGFSG